MVKKKEPWVCEKSVMALPGVCHGSARSPSWLCQESVIALREVRQGGWLCVQFVMALGGIRHLWKLAYASTGNIPAYCTSLRAMTDSWLSCEGLLVEP